MISFFLNEIINDQDFAKLTGDLTASNMIVYLNLLFRFQLNILIFKFHKNNKLNNLNFVFCFIGM